MIRFKFRHLYRHLEGKAPAIGCIVPAWERPIRRWIFEGRRLKPVTIQTTTNGEIMSSSPIHQQVRTTPEPALRAQFLGAFELVVRGKKVAKVPKPVQHLLAQLALAGTNGKNRADLADTLWPDSDPDRARFYLRRSLSQLRVALGPERDRITTDADGVITLGLAGCECDMLRFHQLIQRTDPISLANAVELYGGPFLMGNNEDWIVPLRTDAQQSLTRALAGLASFADENRDIEAAVMWRRKAVHADPLIEANWRDLMSTMAQKGDFAGIARAYRDLQVRLKNELGMSPSRETLEHYRHLLASAKLALTVDDAPPSRTGTPSGLPHPVTTFFGRRSECEEVIQALKDHRLVTLSGPAGVGKTRLALEVAHEVESAFADGVVGVDLGQTRAAAPVEERIASALALGNLQAGVDLAQVIGKRRVLIVIDDAEQCVEECAGVAATLLARCSHLRVLCTSQRPLRVQGERVVSIVPFSSPTTDAADRSRALESEAVQFFLDRARTAAPRFQLTDSNAAAVARVCRRLDGLPLALELAAVCLRTLSPVDLAARLDDRFPLLGSAGEPTRRHATLQTALEWSYDLLGAREKQVFGRLSVFSGTWSVAAAVAVCQTAEVPAEAIPESLANLVEGSLVEFDPSQASGRYRMLESVRAFARTRLSVGPEEPSPERAMALFFLSVLEKLKREGGPDSLLDPLELDAPNLVAALEGLLALHRPEDLRTALRLVSTLFPFWYRVGRISQGYALALRAIAESQEEVCDELVEAIFRAGWAAQCLFKLKESDGLLRQGEELADQLGIQSWTTESLRFRGELAAEQARPAEARELLGEALRRYEVAGDQVGAASCMGFLGYVARQEGAYEEARRLTEGAMALHTAAGDAHGQLWCLGSLGAICVALGDDVQGAAILTEALNGDRKAGNRSSEAWNLTMLAELALNGEDHVRALELVDAALSIHDAEADSLKRIWPLRLRGEALRRAGDFTAAEDALQASARLSRVAGAVSEVAFALLGLSNLKISSGDLASARAYREAASLIAKDAQRADVTRELVRNQAKLEAAKEPDR